MRTLLFVAILATPLGCAHSNAHNLAQRQAVTTPSSDFDSRTRRDDSRGKSTRPVEPPIVTPPIP